MSTYGVLLCVPLFAMLLSAAAIDWRTRRIPNWLSLSLLLTGLVQSFTSGAVASPGQALLGLLTGFALIFVLFVLNAVGGGDVKLLAGVGAWLGPMLVLEIFAAEAIVGMLIVLFQSWRQRRISTLFRNSAVVAINLIHVSELGVEHVSETGQSSRSVDRPLPYAVPVLLATVCVVVAAWAMR